MKKRILALIVMMTLLMAIVPMQAMAASYPLILIDYSDSSSSVMEGDTAKLVFSIFPEFKNERANVRLYNSSGKLVGSATRSFTNSSSLYKTYTVSVDTAQLNLGPGTYTVKYWMEFYSLYQWNTAPNTYSYTFKVVENKCKGNHDFEITYVYTEATCTNEGKAEYTCSDCGHTVTDKIGLADHSYGEESVVLNPTPTTEGQRVSYCENCSTPKYTSIPTSAAVKIKTQPKDASAFENEKAKISVKATGDGLTYQWYYKGPKDSAYKTISGTKSSYSLTMNAARDGRMMKCVVTDQYGNSEESEAVTLTTKYKATITEQPSSVQVASGEKATVTVKATGDGLKYRWYFKESGSSSYTKTSTTTAKYTVTMTDARDGRMLYCEITDAYGNKVKTNEVKLSVKRLAKITTQPQSAKVGEGEKATVTVKATGDGLTYQWYYKNSGAGSFKKSSVTSAKYTTTMKAEYDGRQVYCIVKDAYGNEVKSDTVTFSLKKTVKITAQPSGVKVASGEKATVSVKATGDGLKYRWYFKEAGASSYTKTSTTTAKYSVTMTAERDGRKLYCEITDAYGNQVKSDTATISLKKTVAITSQPKDATKKVGENAKFTVKATGDDLKYQWYYSTDGGSTWKKSSVTKATYSLTVKESYNGRKFYCQVSDSNGNKVSSKKVTLTVESAQAE